MNLEVLRVDPASRIAVGEPWAGFNLAEQRFPVSGEAWQLWGLTRLDTRRDSRILSGMPLTAPYGNPHALAQHLADDPGITTPPVDYATALRFVLDIGYAPNSTLVGTRNIMGIEGAVRALELREARDV